ncbi:GyrI-like domain-containing protein [Parvularcula sp. LCG005]|uniref:GyrI-like domain-containing protein n=1 Tax=Parvularcula sp. LCG005 TaxID=3078805 RepID=UPI00294246A5|nr:GyrI-like domain-containing protein [Parvularcula sp. LCG005]WOI53885.1 GyrI-like domain-containing protein [Parvularcula sp. LCG005]
MTKTDLKKDLKAFYQTRAKTFELVDVPPMNFVMVDGQSSPGDAPAYLEAVQWLYGISYAAKFHAKTELDRDYVVMPLEGLWWAVDYEDYRHGNRDKWQWTLMIMQPDFITPAIFERAFDKTAAKHDAPPPESLRFEAFSEGLSLQMVHIGPYADEAPIIDQLHREIIPARGLVENGHHHEIYLSDPRKSAPEKLKTILRQPVMAAKA